VKAIQIVGRKKSGKTGLTVRLIPLLQRAGLRVGTVKHSSHPHPLDREGSDSWLHRKAGAEATLGITAVAGTLHFDLPKDEEAVEELIGRFLGDLDLVLIEGWSQRKGAKIEVLPADKEGKLREPRHLESGELIAVVLGPGVKADENALEGWGLRLQRKGASAHAGADAGSELSSARGRADEGSEASKGQREAIPAYMWEDCAGVAEIILSWFAAG